jgi:hypothetical protein
MHEYMRDDKRTEPGQEQLKREIKEQKQNKMERQTFLLIVINNELSLIYGL